HKPAAGSRGIPDFYRISFGSAHPDVRAASAPLSFVPGARVTCCWDGRDMSNLQTSSIEPFLVCSGRTQCWFVAISFNVDHELKSAVIPIGSGRRVLICHREMT